MTPETKPLVHSARNGSVLILRIANPPLNFLSTPVRSQLLAAIQQAGGDEEVQAILLLCDGRTFCAGSDITEFERPPERPTLPELTTAIEDLAKPVAVALHGTALGGGFELALACHYRIAAPNARVGLPEITLGMMPGSGGSQRLPRLIAPDRAALMILVGEAAPAPDAAAWGAIDALADGELEQAGLDAAWRLLAGDLKARRGSDLPAPQFTPAMLTQAEALAVKKRRSPAAVQACLAALQAAMDLPFAEAMRRERELFLQLRGSPQAAARRYAFLGEREAAHSPWVAEGTPIRQIRSAAVVGAGTMGSGIATCFLAAGLPVALVDSDAAALERGIAAVRANLTARAGGEDATRRLEMLRSGLDFEAIADADIVIEAVFEDAVVKQSVFEKIDALARPRAILATNTSYLEVASIAAFTRRPKDVAGTHFFSPAHLMKLLECVRGPGTAPDVLATLMTLGKTLGKVAVMVGDSPGFIGNRMLAARTREAFFLLEEGSLPHEVDQAFREFGFPMGPFQVGDMAGLDIFWRARKAAAHLRPAGVRDSRVLEAVCELGRFGQKTGAGWYRYQPGSREPLRDPIVEELITTVSREAGLERRKISTQEILERCLYAMINEGARILELGVAARPVDIDVVWLNGYGFPAERGGPMYYADHVGLQKIVDRILQFRDRFGEAFWEPAPLLVRLAAEAKTFRGAFTS